MDEVEAPAGPLLFLIAGESSGDLLGARLMAALRRQTGGRVRFAGVGGPRMEAEGLESLVPLDELAVMGLVEVLPHIPRLLGHIRRVAEAARRLAPAAVISIDAPSFSLRVQRRLADTAIRRIHYVAPTVWAWRPGRARKIARYLDHLICLLPFEPPYFERHGLATTFVGYPAIEAAAGGDGPAFRRAHDIPADAPVLCAMPGSRASEIRRLMGPFTGAVERLAVRFEGLRVVVPLVPHVAERVEDAVAAWPAPVTVVEASASRADAFAASDVALVKSGTAAVELAAAGVPTVVTQKISWTSALLYLALVRVRWVSLVNMLADREIQPERLQTRCTPRHLAEAVAGLLVDGPDRRDRIAASLEAARRLGLGATPPSEQAAAAILDVLGPAPA